MEAEDRISRSISVRSCQETSHQEGKEELTAAGREGADTAPGTPDRKRAMVA